MVTKVIENGDSKPYWEGVRQNRLLLQRCVKCAHVQFPPRYLCAKCWNTELEWIESTGRGTVESFTIVHRAPTRELRDRVPYVVAAILLEEGPRMITNIVGSDALEAKIDDAVSVTFVSDPSDRVLPQFRRVTEG